MHWCAITALVLVALSCAPEAQGKSFNQTRYDDEDARLNVTELIRKYGYPAEEHRVTTDDGYILTMHRIPFGRKCGEAPDKKIAFVQHGLLSSSADWIVSGPEKALAYILADNCYDVWLGNSRGNTHSRKHISLNPDKDLAFWDFSWHEMGYYDIPAVLDYILHVTKQTGVYYIGHSQGTTQFFVFGSERPEYHSKVKLFVGLAPAAWLQHTVSPPLLSVALYYDIIGWTSLMMGTGEFNPASQFMASVGGLLCSDMFPLYQLMCANSLFLFAGYDLSQMDLDLLPIIMGHTPAGASVKQMVHYGQNIRHLNFAQYDYGILGNELHYGSITPPKYDFTKMNIPVSLHHSFNDWLAQPLDVDTIANHVPNLVGQFMVPHLAFNHLDFMWAKDADTIVYDKVLEVMSGF